MKLKFVSTCIVIVVFALNNQTSAQTKAKTIKKPVKAASAVVKTPIATAQDIEDGKAIMAKSDCVACHAIEDRLIGPSYNSVSEKYTLDATNINSLSQKIINGGSGVWGTVPMAPHPTITTADAGKMVKYILSLSSKNKVKVSK